MDLNKNARNVVDEKSFIIRGCARKIEGHAGSLNMFYQTQEGEEGYLDVCSSSDGEPRRLFYKFSKGKLVKKEGCSGCPYFRGVES